MAVTNSTDVTVYSVCAQVPLFQDMPEDFLRELSMRVVRYVFTPGETIIHTDEPVHEIYIVHRGICRVLYSYTSRTVYKKPSCR